MMSLSVIISIRQIAFGTGMQSDIGNVLILEVEGVDVNSELCSVGVEMDDVSES